MGSSIGPATDRLIQLCKSGYTGTDLHGQPLSVPALSTISPTVDIADVYSSTESGPWVVIGRDNYDQEAQITATAAYEVLGRERISERYTIPGFILVESPGPAYKPVRDACMALFDGFTKLVWADPALAGVLQQGRIGLVSQFTVTQTDPRADKGSASGAAIAAVVTFGVEIQNSYIP